MPADPEACLPSDSCAAAVAIMRRRNCGFVPIVDSHATKRLIGVVTDRDIAVAADKQWAYLESSTAEQKLGEIVEAIASTR